MASLLDPRRRHDMGEADPAVREALRRASVGPGRGEVSGADHLDAVVALCTARLFMPVVDHEGDLSAVKLTHPTGDTALLAFTGADSLAEWNARARPVPGHLDDMAATVVESGADVLLVDVAGPCPFVVGPELVAELAQGHRLVKLADGYGWLTEADHRAEVSDGSRGRAGEDTHRD